MRVWLENKTGFQFHVFVVQKKERQVCVIYLRKNKDDKPPEQDILYHTELDHNERLQIDRPAQYDVGIASDFDVAYRMEKYQTGETLIRFSLVN